MASSHQKQDALIVHVEKVTSFSKKASVWASLTTSVILAHLLREKGSRRQWRERAPGSQPWAGTSDKHQDLVTLPRVRCIYWTAPSMHVKGC